MNPLNADLLTIVSSAAKSAGVEYEYELDRASGDWHVVFYAADTHSPVIELTNKQIASEPGETWLKLRDAAAALKG